MVIDEKIREAGVIGAGGAGFPTHVKVKCEADIVIANGAECEPLLRVDQLVMQHYPQKIVRGIELVKTATQAKEAVVCLKEHYHGAVEALGKAIEGRPGISLKLMKSYYPAGDEQTMVYDVTGRVVPTGGLPIDVGAVVNNVSTFMNIADAFDEGKPVTDKYVTVGGDVHKPVTLKVPVGTTYKTLIEAVGIDGNEEDYTLIIGGPLMGRLCSDWDETVTKATSGVLVFRNEHNIICTKTKDDDTDLKLAKAVCCQCNMCTLMCPRNALGLGVEPHKAMRAAAMGSASLLGEPNGVFSCCDCNLCTFYACNFGLNPSGMMLRMKQGLREAGYKIEKQVKGKPNPDLESGRVPVSRLVARLGLSEFDVPAPLVDKDLPIPVVRVSLRQHIGAPGVPVVKPGDTVRKGDLIAEIKQGALGARAHASIDGVVSDVTDGYVEIRVKQI